MSVKFSDIEGKRHSSFCEQRAFHAARIINLTWNQKNTMKIRCIVFGKMVIDFPERKAVSASIMIGISKPEH